MSDPDQDANSPAGARVNAPESKDVTAAPTTTDDEQAAADDVDLIEDIEEFDPEGWLTEREDYWMERPDPAPPTRLAWLRHRVVEAFRILGSPTPNPWSAARASEEEWTKLAEQALGPLPRPGRQPDESGEADASSSPAAELRQAETKPGADSPGAREAHRAKDKPEHRIPARFAGGGLRGAATLGARH